MSVLLQTSFGDIVVDLYPHKAHNACLNFIKLCKIKHYNNSLFVQVQKDYATQVRSSRATTIWQQVGQKMPYFKDEVDVEMKFKQIGLIATANSGSNLNNSQFFITLTKANLTSLAGKHTIFGKVQEGFDVLKKINDTNVDKNNRPQMNVRILHTHILDDPFEDLQKMTIPRSPSPIRQTDRLQAIEHLQMLQKCRTQKQILEATREQKSKKQAMTLQILGDLPDANLKPPQNILFICKLNPITQQRDLEVIFSRFGPIKSVEVVRDWKTGQSLQYGFVQFENISSCEEAYLKMNNVIIDDRRIQVDFSQSVSKLLHKNRSGLLNTKSKFQPEESTRKLLPKSYTEGKNTQKNYELMINEPQSKKRDAYHEDSRREEKKRPREYQEEQEFQRLQKSKHKHKKQKKRERERERSQSYEREHHRKKYKHRDSRSRSRQVHRKKEKSKKHRRYSDSRS